MVMERLEEMISATKLHDLLHKKDEDKGPKIVLWVLAIVGAVAAVAGIAYLVYRFFTPDELDDFEDDFEEDFDDDEIFDEEEEM